LSDVLYLLQPVLVRKISFFPYTTLFRSGKDGQKYDYFSCSAYDDSAKYIRRYIQEGDYVKIRAVLKNNNYEDEDGEMVYRDVLVDRKSTRLNSSHVSISYAVFCLKKKKI